MNGKPVSSFSDKRNGRESDRPLRLLRSLVRRLLNRPRPYPVRVQSRSPSPRGGALLSYLAEPCRAELSGSEGYFLGHSNKWESREIARLLASEGYDVDVIEWTDSQFVPQREYSVVIDIHKNLERLSPYLGSRCVKIMHLTGSYPRYHNAAELRRLSDLKTRRGVSLQPRRLVTDDESMVHAIHLSDACTLIGNSHTLSTFPQDTRQKIQPVPVSSSPAIKSKTTSQFAPPAREFLWFFGSGAVHKGLDLVLDVFADEPEWILHVVGNIESESDFVAAYRRELTMQPNIHYHGYLLPDSKEFGDIVSKCFSFIAASCSEGISPAAATCMQIGLLPIISLDTGIDLPEACGERLRDCMHQEIRDAVIRSLSLSDEQLRAQIARCQSFALNEYSRERFSERMQSALRQILRTNAR